MDIRKSKTALRQAQGPAKTKVVELVETPTNKEINIIK
jgi:hypothetical protein